MRRRTIVWRLVRWVSLRASVPLKSDEVVLVTPSLTRSSWMKALLHRVTDQWFQSIQHPPASPQGFQKTCFPSNTSRGGDHFSSLVKNRAKQFTQHVYYLWDLGYSDHSLPKSSAAFLIIASAGQYSAGHVILNHFASGFVADNLR